MMKLLGSNMGEDPLWHCCWSHDGKYVATCGKAREICLYLAKDLKIIDKVGNDVHDRTVRSLTFDPVRLDISSSSSASSSSSSASASSAAL